MSSDAFLASPRPLYSPGSSKVPDATYFSRLAPFLALAFAALLPASAQAADPTYTVSGIHVDATAASASAAQAIAIDQGRPRAWDILYKRIAKQSDWSKEPKLDIGALRGLARGYTVTQSPR